MCIYIHTHTRVYTYILIYIFLWLTSFCITGSNFTHLIRTDSNVVFYGWVILHCLYTYHNFLIHHLSRWTSRLLPRPSYCKYCCNEHWGTCVSFYYSFLRVYAQQWNCWIMSSSSRSVVSNSLRAHGLQHIRLPCPSPSPRACSNSCLLSQWWHPTILSSDIPFSSCFQSFPASGSLPVRLFTSGGQSIGASGSASVPPMNIQDWFPLGLTGLIPLLPKGLSSISSNTTVQKYHFFGTQPSLQSNSHIHTWLPEKNPSFD